MARYLRAMPYPEFVRQLGRRVAPERMADRARRHKSEYRERQGVTGIARGLVANGEAVIRSGAFVGLSYPPDRLADVDVAAASCSAPTSRSFTRY